MKKVERPLEGKNAPSPQKNALNALGGHDEIQKRIRLALFHFVVPGCHVGFFVWRSRAIVGRGAAF